VSRVPVPKRYFTVFSTVENRMRKRGYRATFWGTRAIFIRAVPKVFGSVNRPFVVECSFTIFGHSTYMSWYSWCKFSVSALEVENGEKSSDVSRLLSLLQWEIMSEIMSSVRNKVWGFFPIFYFKRRNTNLNLHQEYLDLHALHRFNAIFRTWADSPAPFSQSKC